MAGYNPFRGFRKNQKLWFAILTIGTMISFIILPALMQLFSGLGGSAKPGEIVRCRRFGNIDEQSIQALYQQREQLGRFYEVLARRLLAPDGSNQMELQGLLVMAQAYNNRVDEETVIDSWLLSRYAASQGISISQTGIVAHLSQLTGGLLTDQAFQDVLKAVGMTERRLEYLVGEEILSLQVRQGFEVAQLPVVPSTRWAWFQRLNRRMTAEVAAVSVDQFVSKVAEPSDAQLRKFFDENKDNVFNPTVPESGFTVPNQIAFQYVRATPSPKMLESISKEDVEKYYEANKEPMFRKPVKPLGERPTLPGQDPGSIFKPNLGGFTPGSMPFPAPSTRKVTPTTSEEPAKPAEEPRVEPKPAVEEKPAAEEKAPEEKKETSLLRREVTTRLVSYQTETPDPMSGGADPVKEGKVEEKKEEPPKSEEKKEEPKAEAKPAEPAKPADEPKAEAKPEEKKEEPKAEVKPTEPAKPAAEEKVDLSILYKPLSEVEDQIRRILAQEKIDRGIAVIEGKMREYFQQYNLHEDQNTTAPVMPDLTALVAEQGLELVSTPFGTIFDAVKTEFARGMKEREYLLQIYREMPILFEPNVIDGDASKILIWAIEAKAEYKPEKFEEVKDTVLGRWKEVQARPLAEKRAEELADEARKAGKTLAEAFASQPDVKVVQTEPFTWKSYGESMYAAFFAMRGIPPQLDEVREKGVESGNSEIDNKLIFAPGEKFMEVASGLQVGGIGVVSNAPQTMVYVVRIEASSPSEDALWERFQHTSFQEYRLAGQPEVRRQAMEVWLKKIQDEVGFQWMRKPRMLERR